MRRLAVLAALAALAACNEPTINRPPPVDSFYFPVGVALATRTGTTVPALLVSSANFDLRYGPQDGGTLLSVRPETSLGAPGGALDVVDGRIIGSYAGPVTVATPATCPGLAGPVALVASRFKNEVVRLPLTADGGFGPCPAAGCEVPTRSSWLGDPYAIEVACRADGTQRFAFVSYLTSRKSGVWVQGTGWLTAYDLDAPEGPSQVIPAGFGNIAGMTYDASSDRLFAVGRRLLGAPLFVLSLPGCHLPDASCPLPTIVTLDLYTQLRGAELQSIALSNPQAGFGRRAYVSARVYDPDLAILLGGRPSGDIGSVILVLDMEDDVSGRPAARLLRAVSVGAGAGEVRVLPARTGLRDLVVVSSSTSGNVTVYDDEVGAVVNVTALDSTTGAPVAGREPYGLAVEDVGPDLAYVWVAAFDDSQVSRLEVPLHEPGLTHLTRSAGTTGTPLRIGRKRQ